MFQRYNNKMTFFQCLRFLLLLVIGKVLNVSQHYVHYNSGNSNQDKFLKTLKFFICKKAENLNQDLIKI